jgi:hypothetical protein
VNFCSGEKCAALFSAKPRAPRATPCHNRLQEMGLTILVSRSACGSNRLLNERQGRTDHQYAWRHLLQQGYI